MLRQIAGLCLIASLATASAAQAGDAPNFKATAHRVAVLSLLGDEFNFGATSTPVPGAGFDALTENAIVKQIKHDLPGVTVTKADAPRAELLTQMYPPGGDNEAGMGNVRGALRLWAAEHQADYIVVFRKSAGEPFVGAPGFSFFGIGLAPKNGKGAPVPAALLNVTVLDGASLEVVADLSARDTDWSQYDFKRGAPEASWLPRLTSDAKAMLSTMAPTLVHGVGL